MKKKIQNKISGNQTRKPEPESQRQKDPGSQIRVQGARTGVKKVGTRVKEACP